MIDSQWSRVRLGDLVTIKHGWPFKSEQFSEVLSGGPIVVSIGNFQYTGGFRFDSTTVKEYRGEYPKEFDLAGGETLLVMTCQTAGGEILGIPARVPKDGRTYLHNQRIGKVVVKPGAQVEEDFLYWLFLTREFNQSLAATATGSKILHTAPSRIEAFEFFLPPKREQSAIAHVLGALDEKIGMLRRMNRTLEDTCRALFQSWFVDFDPVRAKAAGRVPSGMDAETAKLFPSSFDESQSRPIPLGWNVSTIGESCLRVAMGPFGSDIKTDNFVTSGVPVVRGGNLTHGFVDDSFVFVSEAKADELRNANAFPEDIVITHRGTLGQVGLIPKKSRFPRYVVSQSQMLVSADPEKVSPRYLFEYLRSPGGQHALLANTSQTGVPAIARPTTSVKAIPIVVPPNLLLRRFDEISERLAERHTHNEHESRTLAETRDTLLPKLLSGALRIPDPDRFLQEAGL